MSLQPASPRVHYSTAANELKGNPGQWAAYESEGNCVLLAGPGSGKTKTLTTKLARILAEDVRPPSGLACLTYSSECARELQRRLTTLGVEERHNVFIGTVHAFCLKNIVLPYSHLSDVGTAANAVASVKEQDAIFDRAVNRIIGEDRASKYKLRCEVYRRTYLDREHPDFLSADEQIAPLVLEYERLLDEAKLIDFDGMVLTGLRMIERHEWVRKAIKARFPVLVIDEYQDLGVALHRIVLSLCQNAGLRLLAVGDPDQSIYGFTGAQPKLLQNLADQKWLETVYLKFNYRCGKRIVVASETALGEERNYESKCQQEGTINFYECPDGSLQQATFICEELIPAALKRVPGTNLGKMAVLYPDKSDGDIIATAALNAGFQFIRIDNGAPYRRTQVTRWVEECATWCAGGWREGTPALSTLTKVWLKLNHITKSEVQRRALRLSLTKFLFGNRNPELSLSVWLNLFHATCLGASFKSEPTLKDDAEVFNNMLTAAKEDGKLGKFTIATFSGQGGSPDHLNLITLHSAKGLEFDVVVLMGMDQDKLPSWSADTPEKKLEARRLFYVGITRAKHEVHLTYSGWTENKYGRRFHKGPSEFLIELKDRLESD
jgi:DNA helicase-2/ATP-dependent DNA helicase PcrA